MPSQQLFVGDCISGGLSMSNSSHEEYILSAVTACNVMVAAVLFPLSQAPGLFRTLVHRTPGRAGTCQHSASMGWISEIRENPGVSVCEQDVKYPRLPEALPFLEILK